MKAENYFALNDALHRFGIATTACAETNGKWTDTIDKDVASSIDDLLKVLDHILEDEKTPEIIRLECDLLDI